MADPAGAAPGSGKEALGLEAWATDMEAGFASIAEKLHEVQKAVEREERRLRPSAWWERVAGGVLSWVTWPSRRFRV